MTPPLREKSLEAFVGFRIPAKLKADLEKLAEKQDRPLSYVIREALEAHVARARKK